MHCLLHYVIPNAHAGLDVYNLAPFAVTQEHADRAIANLRRFTLVLALERLDAEAWGLLSRTMNLTSTPMHQAKTGTNYGACRSLPH
jgi:hypothetical protein